MLQYSEEDEDKGSIAHVMSENSLLTVLSMDGLHTNPMHVCVSLRVRLCVCVLYIFSVEWRKSFPGKMQQP